MKPFNTLALEITSDCNRRCAFCPVAYNTRPVEEMPVEWVERAADELEGNRFRGRVEFYIYNEPLKNRGMLYTALEIFKKRCPRATLMISSNGDFMKSADEIRELFSRGLQQLVLNAYTAKQYPRFKSWAAEFPGAEEQPVYRALPRGKVAIKVYDKSAPSTFGTGIFRIQNRAGTVPNYIPPTPEPLKRMCVKPFRLLNINWRGEALICCNDYHGDVVAGKFPEQGLYEIWNGPVLAAYRAKLKQKDRSLPLCRVCDCHSGAYPANVGDDDVDPVKLAEDVETIEEHYQARVRARTGFFF